MLIRKLFQMAGPAILGAAMLASGLAGCEQATETGDKPSNAASDPGLVPAGKTVLDEGHLLQGEELKAFLAERSRMHAAPTVADPATGPLAKTALGPTCLIDFNSQAGLTNMPDHAYGFYAGSPWYYQGCSPYKAVITPSDYNTYYLVPEENGVCVGTKPNMGYGTGAGASCPNQKDAKYFHRWAGNLTPSSGVGIRTQLTDIYGTAHAFRLNSFVGKSGTIKVLAYRVGIGWWYWGPLPSNNTYWTFSNADNVTEVVFYPWSSADNLYGIDNINVNPL
jgi:hypothetical protein